MVLYSLHTYLIHNTKSIQNQAHGNDKEESGHVNRSIEVATNYTKEISARVNFRDIVKLNLIGKNISKFTVSYVQLVKHYLINHPNIKEGMHAT